MAAVLVSYYVLMRLLDPSGTPVPKGVIIVNHLFPIYF